VSGALDAMLMLLSVVVELDVTVKRGSVVIGSFDFTTGSESSSDKTILPSIQIKH